MPIRGLTSIAGDRLRHAGWISTLLLTVAPAALCSQPWRLNEALGTSEALDVSGTYRLRFENSHHPFSTGSTGSDQLLSHRLLVSLRYGGSGNWYLGGELQDSRAWLHDGATPLGTDDVNSAELLRAYIGYQRENLAGEGSRLEVTAGRITMDGGSTRFLIRNRYRNTINAFTGVEANLRTTAGGNLQLFWTYPLNRQPTDRDSLEHNDSDFDTSSSRVRFSGIYFSQPRMIGDATGEVYLFSLREGDKGKLSTRDRHLTMPGVRILRMPEAGRNDFELEIVYQYGYSSRSTSPADPRLDHEASYVHAELGYTAPSRWTPRVALVYDRGSGDSDPLDDRNQRFDALYGASRSDLGPSGIFGALSRGNIDSPGIRLEVRPNSRMNAFVLLRQLRLTSSRDVFAGTGIHDPAGEAGKQAGYQIDSRVRYEIIPGSLLLEAGITWLDKGHFFAAAPNSPGTADTTYLNTNLILTF